MPLRLRICIDVDDLDRAIAFYGEALGLTVGRRAGSDFAEMLGGPVPIDLLSKAEGTQAAATTRDFRRYQRHWTPVHLDFEVDDLDEAFARALAAGAEAESPPMEKPWGRIALLSDPFGHGFCLLEMGPLGYDAITDSE